MRVRFKYCYEIRVGNFPSVSDPTTNVYCEVQSKLILTQIETGSYLWTRNFFS